MANDERTPTSRLSPARRNVSIDGTGSVKEVDHLIPLSLGGADEAANLWPESFDTMPWNALEKDKLEVRLHALVCGGQMPLVEAQKAIAENWIAAYERHIGR